MLKAKRIMVLLVATFSVVCSPALADKLPDMFIKSGSDYSATQSAVAECQKQSVNVHAPEPPLRQFPIRLASRRLRFWEESRKASMSSGCGAGLFGDV